MLQHKKKSHHRSFRANKSMKTTKTSTQHPRIIITTFQLVAIIQEIYINFMATSQLVVATFIKQLLQHCRQLIVERAVAMLVHGRQAYLHHIFGLSRPLVGAFLRRGVHHESMAAAAALCTMDS